MVNTRKYKKTKGGWPWSKSIEQPGKADKNDCTVIATKSIDDIDDMNLDNLENLVKQRNTCKVSNQSLEFTVDDTTIEDIIAKKKQIIEKHRTAAETRKTEETAKRQLDDAAKVIAANREKERENAEAEYIKCRKTGEDPPACPGHEIYGKTRDRKVGGNRRTKRKHKKFKKAKSKRRSIKRRMNK